MLASSTIEQTSNTESGIPSIQSVPSEHISSLGRFVLDICHEYISPRILKEELKRYKSIRARYTKYLVDFPNIQGDITTINQIIKTITSTISKHKDLQTHYGKEDQKEFFALQCFLTRKVNPLSAQLAIAYSYSHTQFSRNLLLEKTIFQDERCPAMSSVEYFMGSLFQQLQFAKIELKKASQRHTRLESYQHFHVAQLNQFILEEQQLRLETQRTLKLAKDVEDDFMVDMLLIRENLTLLQEYYLQTARDKEAQKPIVGTKLQKGILLRHIDNCEDRTGNLMALIEPVEENETKRTEIMQQQTKLDNLLTQTMVKRAAVGLKQEQLQYNINVLEVQLVQERKERAKRVAKKRRSCASPMPRTPFRRKSSTMEKVGHKQKMDE